jgi:hypothetical protein
MHQENTALAYGFVQSHNHLSHQMHEENTALAHGFVDGLVQSHNNIVNTIQWSGPTAADAQINLQNEILMKTYSKK